jgi:voltage-gated sodium channel
MSLAQMVGGSHGYNKIPTCLTQMNMEPAGAKERRKQHIASNTWFNVGITIAIILNVVMVGLEADYARSDQLEDRLGFLVLDLLFTLLFFAEMLIRQNQLGWDYFIDPWNLLDYLLVVLNAMDLVVSVTRSARESLRLASVFRALRLMRLARNIKGLKVFYGLWMVLQGMLDSLRTLIWVAVLVVMLLYTVAVILTSVASSHPYLDERWRYYDQYVGSVLTSFWTVIQVVTLDNWATDIGRPLGEASPFCLFLVILTIVIITFGTMNIVISVMVERMQTIALQSQEMTAKVLEQTENDLLASLAEDLRDAASDDTGEVTKDQFKSIIRENPLIKYKLRLLGIQGEEASSIFDIMDADHSGSVSPAEFVAGLNKLKGVASGQDLVQLICFAQKQCLRADTFVERLREMSKRADLIQERMNNVGKGMTGELSSRNASDHRNDVVWEGAAIRQNFIGLLDKHRQIHFPDLAPVIAEPVYDIDD